MDIVEKAKVKLTFVDSYLAFIMDGIKRVPVDRDVVYYNQKFIMAMVYDAHAQEFSLHYNSKQIGKEKYTLDNVVDLLKHELGHILNNHFGRLEDRDPIRFNIAGDIAIDQFLENIPRSKEELDTFKKKYGNMVAEEIYWKLPYTPKQIPKSIFVIVNSQMPQTCPQCNGSGKELCPTCRGEKQVECKECEGTGQKEGTQCGNCGGEGKQDCPDCNGEGNTGKPCPMCGGKGTIQNMPMVVPREEISDVVEKLVKETTGKELKEIAQHGNQPGIWGMVACNLESHELDWKIIHKYLASLRERRQRTLKKPSKRFPSPWGMRKRYEPKLTVAIDCSGSIDDMELEAFINEVSNLSMITERIHLIFADCAVQKVVENYRPRQNLGTIPGRGGTDYDPALKYIHDKWKDTDLIVYLTDGECHPPSTKLRIPILWVVTRNYELGVAPMIKAPGLNKSGRGY